MCDSWATVPRERRGSVAVPYECHRTVAEPQYNGSVAVPQCHGSHMELWQCHQSASGVWRCQSGTGVPWKCGSARRVPWECGSGTVSWKCGSAMECCCATVPWEYHGRVVAVPQFDGSVAVLLILQFFSCLPCSNGRVPVIAGALACLGGGGVIQRCPLHL